jgi:hypothetical protein
MSEIIGTLNFCRLSGEKVIFPDQTQVDPDGTIHFTNGWVMKPIGEHGIGKPNEYEFFQPDGTKLEQEVIFAEQTQTDPDGTIHITNGWVMKPIGEHGVGKPNEYEFFQSDGTQLE